ncbi:peroxidase [Ranunculus cassubicifolius]
MEVLAALGTVLLLLNFMACSGVLQVGFYHGKCGNQDVESIIRSVISARFLTNPRIVAALLRIQFHDCFVRGCDASILLDGFSSEKTSPPNLSLWGFDIIDQAKAAVESVCPGVVSCADIIALATRDAVYMSGGLSWRYDVPTGRRDGLISLARNVDIPTPTMSVSESILRFARKGLAPTDMVVLLGGHSVGVTHCSVIQDRLYNFRNTGQPDPTMDPLLAMGLRLRCPREASHNNTVDLDQNFFSSTMVDSSYYKQIKMNRGVLRIDQELAWDPLTSSVVTSLANAFNFPSLFGDAMVKLGSIEVLTGWQGEIRRNCRYRL